jgi:hypothetical protein
MTVFESLASWLYGILSEPGSGLPGTWKVDNETLPDYTKEKWESAALYSNPNDIQEQMTAGQIRHTDYKTFYIRRDFGNVTTQIKNEAVLEKLKKCIHDKALDGIYPKDGRQWRGISYHGGAYPSTKEATWAIYQITLKLVYIEMG